LDVYHASTRCGLSANLEAWLKCAAGGSLKYRTQKNRQKIAIGITTSFYGRLVVAFFFLLLSSFFA